MLGQLMMKLHRAHLVADSFLTLRTESRYRSSKPQNKQRARRKTSDAGNLHQLSQK
jgi:hypothetical protein